MYTNAVLVCLSAHCNTSVLSCLLQMQIIMLAILCISLIFTLTFVYIPLTACTIEIMSV